MNDIPQMLQIKQYILIDDDDTTLFLCRIIIQRICKNISVVTFNNPKKALDYFTTTIRAGSVSAIVLLDINMPEMSGWDVLDSVSLFDADIKDKLTVIMLSSSIDPEDRLKSSNHPLVVGHLEKPLIGAKLEVLLTKIKSESVV